MRLLLVLTIIVMALGLLAFSMNNLGTTVSVTLLNTTTQLRLWEVVGFSVLIGVVATSVIAVAEGTKTRLENRRLRREVHKLETELNFLRTQPSLQKPKSEAESEARNAATAPTMVTADSKSPPSAPVYDTDAGNGTDDGDDDVYTGGRAV
jgi:uncharacterized membrane protein YciS (DUF1049 family)